MGIEYRWMELEDIGCIVYIRLPPLYRDLGEKRAALENQLVTDSASAGGGRGPSPTPSPYIDRDRDREPLYRYGALPRPG